MYGANNFLETTTELGARNEFVDLTYTDLTGLSGSTQTVNLAPYKVGDLLEDFCFDLITPFAGASVTNLTVAMGFNDTGGSSSTTAFMAAQELCATGYANADDGSVASVSTTTFNTITYGNTVGLVVQSMLTALNQLVGRKRPANLAGNITGTFTQTGGAGLSALTAGHIRFYYKRTKLTSFRNPNND